MDFSLADLGAIGEFVGAFAVIASLLYLAAQIRHGIRASEGAAVQNVTGQFATMQFEVARDGELSELIGRAKRGEALSQVEAGRVGDFLSAYLLAFENMYVQHQHGLLGYESFEARERVIAWMLGSPWARRWWFDLGSRTHPEAFVREINRILEEADREAARMGSDLTPVAMPSDWHGEDAPLIAGEDAGASDEKDA